MSEGLRVAVPTSFLQDRVMGKLNADTANLALLLFLLRRRGPGLKQAVSICVNIDVRGTKPMENQTQTNFTLNSLCYICSFSIYCHLWCLIFQAQYN